MSKTPSPKKPIVKKSASSNNSNNIKTLEDFGGCCESYIGMDIHKLSSEKYDKGNNVLHAAAWHGNTKIIKDIFNRCKYKDEYKAVLKGLLNERNNEGTNPLGMIFTDENAFDEKKREVAKLFISHKDFKVNNYLNNKKGMDYTTDSSLKDIGGFNVLHIAIMRKYPDILDFLSARNENIGWGNESAEITNFFYSSLNPDYHMTSPVKLLDSTIPQRQSQVEDAVHGAMVDRHEAISKKLHKLQRMQKAKQDEDDSGDSDTEGAPAHFYKQELLKLKKIIEEDKAVDLKRQDTAALDQILNTKTVNEEYKEKITEKVIEHHENIVISHFHGITLMQGQYTNYQIREIAKKLLEFNNAPLKKIEVTNNKGKEKMEDSSAKLTNPKEKSNELNAIIKGLHSRTSTANSQIESLFDLINASPEQLAKLDEVDKKLQNYLSSCYKSKPDKFLEAIKIYIYDFSKKTGKKAEEIKKEEPHKKFWEALQKIEKVPIDIIKYRFPFISTSKAPDHATKFGIGVSIEKDRGEGPLHPSYDELSYPKHRLAGFLVVTFHSLMEIDHLEHNKQIADITKLLKSKQIEKIDAKKEHINNQIENTFFGGIDSKNIKAIIPIVYPNLSKSYNEKYHQLWDLTVEKGQGTVPANNFEEARKNFKNQESPKLYDDKSKLTSTGKVMIPAVVKLAVDLSYTIAKQEGKELYYYSPEGKLEKYSIEYVKNSKKDKVSKGDKVSKEDKESAFFSKTQTDIRKSVVAIKDIKNKKGEIIKKGKTVEEKDFNIIAKKISAEKSSKFTKKDQSLTDTNEEEKNVLRKETDLAKNNIGSESIGTKVADQKNAFNERENIEETAESGRAESTVEIEIDQVAAAGSNSDYDM